MSLVQDDSKHVSRIVRLSPESKIAERIAGSLQSSRDRGLCWPDAELNVEVMLRAEYKRIQIDKIFTIATAHRADFEVWSVTVSIWDPVLHRQPETTITNRDVP